MTKGIFKSMEQLLVLESVLMWNMDDEELTLPPLLFLRDEVVERRLWVLGSRP